jgi:hypothetical protein
MGQPVPIEPPQKSSCEIAANMRVLNRQGAYLIGHCLTRTLTSTVNAAHGRLDRGHDVDLDFPARTLRKRIQGARSAPQRNREGEQKLPAHPVAAVVLLEAAE